jgi:hypothetical protein
VVLGREVLVVVVVELLAGLPEATAYVIDLGLTAGFDFRRSFGISDAVCAITMHKMSLEPQLFAFPTQLWHFRRSLCNPDAQNVTRTPTFCISDAVLAFPTQFVQSRCTQCHSNPNFLLFRRNVGVGFTRPHFGEVIFQTHTCGWFTRSVLHDENNFLRWLIVVLLVGNDRRICYWERVSRDRESLLCVGNRYFASEMLSEKGFT